MELNHQLKYVTTVTISMVMAVTTNAIRKKGGFVSKAQGINQFVD